MKTFVFGLLLRLCQSEILPMKLVIKVGAGVTNRSGELLKLADAVRALLHDGHRVVLIHGGREAKFGRIAELSQNACLIGVRPLPSEPLLCQFSSVYLENRCLVAPLIQLGVQALGLSASDAGAWRVRKINANGDGPTVELIQVDQRWLDIICNNGGVPVISNQTLAGWGEYYLLDSDQMAAAYAVGWKADVLIYLTTITGVHETSGTIMRLLDLNELESLEQQLVITGDMLLKLRRCKEALKRGVGRVRIVPLYNVDVLKLLFYSRIEYGTEVFITSTGRP